MMRRLLLALMFVPTLAAAQAPRLPKVGDVLAGYEVCIAREWCKVTVTKIEGDTITVQYGPNRFDTRTVPVSEAATRLRDWAAFEAERNAIKASDDRTQAFMNEINRYGRSIASAAGMWDPQYRIPTAGYTYSDELEQQIMDDLKAVHEVCRKYPGIKNLSKPPRDAAPIFVQVDVLCRLAADHATIKKRAHLHMFDVTIEAVNQTKQDEIKKVIDGETYVPDYLQLLAFETDAWVKAEAGKLAKDYAKWGEQPPADAFKPTIAKIPDLVAKIDRDGQANTFDPPKFRDAAVEGLVKAELAKSGAKVIAIGGTYQAWAAYDEKSWVKSDNRYDYYRVTKGKNKYKRGRVLVQVPNRPHCQSREWIVKKVGGGRPVVDYIDPGGAFVRCK